MSLSKQKHYSDESLLAWLDGETSRRTAVRIDKHLKSCWDCRSRCNELNEQAIALASLMRVTPFPGIREEADARGRLLASMRAYELQAAFKSDLSRASVRVPWIAGSVAAVVAAVFVFFLILPRTSKPPQQATELSRTTQEERVLLNAAGVLHQVVNVQLTDGTPNAKPKIKRIEIWNDRNGHRFSAKVTAGQGEIEYAVWHPGAGRSFATGPGRGISPVPESTADDLSLVDYISSSRNANLAEAFEGWIRKRPWRPITIAHDFASFAGPNHNTLQVRRQVEGGKEVFLVTAQRQIQGHSAEMSLLVDGATFKPFMQRLTLVSGNVKSEITFSIHNEVLKPEEVALSDFTPDNNLLASIESGGSESVDHLDAHQELYSDEVLTLKALEDLGITRSNIIELSPSVNGELLLRLMVPNEERRDELSRALTKDRPYLKVEAQVAPPEVTPKGPIVPPQLSVGFIDSWNRAYNEDLELIDLNNRFNETRIRGLSMQARETLKGLSKEHLDLLESYLRISAKELGISTSGRPSSPEDHVAENDSTIHGVTADEFFAGMDKLDDQLERIQNPETSAKDRADAFGQLPLLLERSLTQLPQLRSEVDRHLSPSQYKDTNKRKPNEE